MASFSHALLLNSSEVDFKAEKPNFSKKQRLNLLFLLREMHTYDCKKAETEESVCKAVKELFDGFPFQEVDCAKYLMTNHIAKGSKLAKFWVIEIEQAKPSVIKFFYKDGHSQLITSITAKVKLPAADNDNKAPSYSEWTPKHISNTYEKADPPNDDKQNNSKLKISIEAKELPAADGLSPSYSRCTPHTNSHGYEEVDVLRDNKQDNLKPKISIEAEKLPAADEIAPCYSRCTPHTNSHGYEEMDVLRDNKQDNLKTEISIEAKKLPAADGIALNYSRCTPHTDSHGYEEVDVLRDDKQDNLKPKIHVDVDKNVNSSYNSHQPRVAYVPAFPSEAGNKDSESKPYEPYRPDYEVFQFKFKPKISK